MIRFLKIVLLLVLIAFPDIKADATDGTGIVQACETKCVLPSPVENGKYSIISSVSGDSIEPTPGELVVNGTLLVHECNHGFYSKSTSSIDTCHNGKWKKRFHGCIRVNKCVLPEFPQNGNYEITGSSITTATPGEQVLEFTILTFFCAPLYELVDARKVVCIEGAWTKDPPSCKRNNSCVLPDVPNNGQYSIIGSSTTAQAGEAVEERTALYYSCDPGYSLKDSKITYCLSGSWIGGPVECKGSMLEPAVYNECSDVSGNSGIYVIKPNEQSGTITVYCELNFDDKKWTVIQQRVDGSVNFYRNYTSYQNFFGDLQGNHWIGLDNLHQLTKDEDHELYVELEAHDGSKAFARYDRFVVGSSTSGYELSISGYRGTAGDSMRWSNNELNGMKFCTYDNDQDKHPGHCAEDFNGAWWFNNCATSNLNGPYHNTAVEGELTSIFWYTWRDREALKYTRMLVRKRNSTNKHG